MVRVNRRQLTGALLAGAAKLNAQTPAVQQAVPQDADEMLAEARRQVAVNRSSLHRFPLPMSTEPASAFKAS